MFDDELPFRPTALDLALREDPVAEGARQDLLAASRLETPAAGARLASRQSRDASRDGAG